MTPTGAAKTGIFALLAIAMPPTGDFAQWAQWGLASAVVFYVMHHDRQRERRMQAAINECHKHSRETMSDLIERSTAALEKLAARGVG